MVGPQTHSKYIKPKPLRGVSNEQRENKYRINCAVCDRRSGLEKSANYLTEWPSYLKKKTANNYFFEMNQFCSHF